METDSKPNLQLPAVRENILSGETKELGLPFSEAAFQVISEFESLPQKREEGDLPDRLAYLYNEDKGVLVMIRKRVSPTTRKDPFTIIEGGYGDGYFAEVFTVKNAEVKYEIPNTDVEGGAYKRIEISDDPKKNPFDRKELVPTLFPQAYREYIQSKIGQKALTESYMEDRKPIEELFYKIIAQRNRRAISPLEKKGLFEIITKKFDFKTFQAMAEFMDNSAIVVSDQEGESPLTKALDSLGIDVQKFSLTEKDKFLNFLDSWGSQRQPLALIVDNNDKSQSLTADGIYSRIVRVSEFVPNFALVYKRIKLGEDSDKKPNIIRSSIGEYQLENLNEEELYRFFMKIGVDAYLTEQVRQIASIFK